jgi:hypothetical protein
MIAAVLQQTPHRHRNISFAVAVFCCIAFFSGAASAAVSWKNIATFTTLTNNQMCYTDGTNIVCDSSAPTLLGGNVGIGTASPASTLEVWNTNGNNHALEVVGAAAGNAEGPSVYIASNGSGYGPSFKLDATSNSGGHYYTFYSSGVSDGTGAGDFGIYDNTSSASRLAINTNGGLAVGSYASTASAPSQGIAVSGKVGIGTTTPGDTLTVKGDVGYMLGADYTTTGSQSDVNLGAVSAVRYNGAAAATFQGIVAGTSGQILYLHNPSAYTLTLADQSDSTDATAANKIITGIGSDLGIPTNTSVTLQYDTASSRWRVTGSSNAAKSLPAGSTGQVQFNNAGAFGATANFFLAQHQQSLGDRHLSRAVEHTGRLRRHRRRHELRRRHRRADKRHDRARQCRDWHHIADLSAGSGSHGHGDNQL